MPMPSSIASFTTLSASISAANPCAAGAAPKPSRMRADGYVDNAGALTTYPQPRQQPKIHSKQIGRLTTAQTQCHKTIGQRGDGPGRHHVGIAGAIILE
jgi:hypothetical protein